MVEHNFNEGKISKCQICNSKKLLKIIELGNQPLANSLLEKNENVKNKFPICVVRCNECTLIQIDHIVNQSEVYHLDYPYLPGITKTVDDEQKEFSNFLIERLSLKSKDLVVDFGSNDGSLLKHLKNQKVKVIGVEPTNIAKIANKNGALCEFYSHSFGGFGALLSIINVWFW